MKNIKHLNQHYQTSSMKASMKNLFVKKSMVLSTSFALVFATTLTTISMGMSPAAFAQNNPYTQINRSQNQLSGQQSLNDQISDYEKSYQQYLQSKSRSANGNIVSAGQQSYGRIQNTPAQNQQAQVQKVSYGNYQDYSSMNDVLGLQAQSALIIDEDTNRVLYEKNPKQVRQIASITKLMTALVVLEAGSPMDEIITISRSDLTDQSRSSRGVVGPGDRLTRYDTLLFALMYSENQAASALARHYPGGKSAFIARMNQKAREMGMMNTYFADTVGMSVENVSTAADLGRLVYYAAQNPVIRSFSTQPSYRTMTETRVVQGNNTNPFVRDPSKLPGLQITTQKTGYINKSGPCMVMHAKIQGRSVIMVFLGSKDRQVDVLKVHNWITGRPLTEGIGAVRGIQGPAA